MAQETRGGTLKPTTIMLTHEQRAWLRRQALERAMKEEAGKSDGSAIVRELLDRAMRKGAGRRTE